MRLINKQDRLYKFLTKVLPAGEVHDVAHVASLSIMMGQNRIVSYLKSKILFADIY